MSRPLPDLDALAAEARWLLALDTEKQDPFATLGPAETVCHLYLHGECDRFAHALGLLTGWPCVALLDETGTPVHRLVRSPRGRLLDASGWTNLRTLRRRYGSPHLTLREDHATDEEDDDLDPEGYLYHRTLAVAAARQLPWSPFCDPAFTALARTDLPGVDTPVPEDEENDFPCQ